MADSGETLAYDLRQRYAEMVAEHLIDIAVQRKAKNYPKYFTAIEDLECVVNHKFRKNKQKNIDDEGGYNNLIKEAIDIANKYRNTFTGISNNPEEVAKIEKSLRDIEKFLYKVMDNAKMFGSNWDSGGL
jgi:hypothetical protein